MWMSYLSSNPVFFCPPLNIRIHTSCRIWLTITICEKIFRLAFLKKVPAFLYQIFGYIDSSDLSLCPHLAISSALQIRKNSSTLSSRIRFLSQTLAYNRLYGIPVSLDNSERFMLFSFKYLPTLFVVPFVMSLTSHHISCSLNHSSISL